MVVELEKCCYICWIVRVKHIKFSHCSCLAHLYPKVSIFYFYFDCKIKPKEYKRKTRNSKRNHKQRKNKKSQTSHWDILIEIWYAFMTWISPPPLSLSSNLIWEEVRAVMREENSKKKKKKTKQSFNLKKMRKKKLELKYKILASTHMLRNSFIFFLIKKGE